MRKVHLLLAVFQLAVAAPPLCDRSKPVCVVNQSITINAGSAASCDGAYNSSLPSCAWNSSNQSLVIAANVTVRCDRPSNAAGKDACKLAFDFRGGITLESGARVSGGSVNLTTAGRIVVKHGARVDADGMGRCGRAWVSATSCGCLLYTSPSPRDS